MMSPLRPNMIETNNGLGNEIEGTNFMKPIILLATIFLLTTVTVWADDDELEAAEESALSWLTLTDHSEFESSWTSASPFFRAAISESDWVRSLTAARSSLGGLNSREIAAATFSKVLPGGPDGKYVIFQFDTIFGNQTSATETVAMMKDEHDVWKVAGYFIEWV